MPDNNNNMTVLQRLTLELSNKQYLTQDEYTQFLSENNLSPTDTYNRSTMQKTLLFTVIDILEVVANDVDIMRKVETEFTTVSDAYKYLTNRIQKIKDKIASIPESEEEYSPFSLMYTR
jgi:DNA polymerase II small subunit/DNA polymerase delta subunit B